MYLPTFYRQLLTFLFLAMLLTACLGTKQTKRLDPKKRIPCPQKDC